MELPSRQDDGRADSLFLGQRPACAQCLKKSVIAATWFFRLAPLP